MRKDKILVTGAGGQLGTALVAALRQMYGAASVIATDLKMVEDPYFETLDVTDGHRMEELVRKHQITQIYHLAAILSAMGERKPRFTWDINMNGLLNVLEVGRVAGLSKIYFPSSIAIYGENTPVDHTPQQTIFDPTTIYGISKLAGELWADYYFKRYGLDVRSLRYPGLISYETLPGGGTTDYAVDIFYKAIEEGRFACFLEEDTRLPMMYMPDAIRATLELMDAPLENISIHSSYNLSGMSFTPNEIYQEIKRHLPHFEMSYEIDPLRQKIANSWSDTIDDSMARRDWGWKEAYDLESMTKDMLVKLKEKLKETVGV